jgi:Ser-tRNA(Ala) deacylase AlaX
MTTLLYLKNTYQFEATATVLELREHEEKGLALILDQTILYPQGGGQPADHGSISSESGSFNVTDVGLDADGIVWHFGNFESGELKTGDAVNLHVDEDRRRLNARIHSAGHLLDCAVTALGLNQLKPGKGFHFPDGPYVEYEGIVENPEEVLLQIQTKMDELIANDLPVHKENLSEEEAAARKIWAPPGKSARVVKFEGFEGCGCGGTHVEQSSSLGHVTIRKVKSKKGKTKIAYLLE